MQTMCGVASSAIGMPADGADSGNGEAPVFPPAKEDGSSANVRTGKTIIDIMAFVTMAAFYVSLITIMVGLIVMKSPVGKEAPLPTSLTCTLVLTALYFSVFGSSWLLALVNAQGDP